MRIHGVKKEHALICFGDCRAAAVRLGNNGFNYPALKILLSLAIGEFSSKEFIVCSPLAMLVKRAGLKPNTLLKLSIA